MSVMTPSQMEISTGVGPLKLTINTTPWFHRGGLHCAGPCPAFYAGAAVVVLPKFEAKTALEYVSEYGITFLVGVPTVLGNLADEQEKNHHNLSSLKGIVTMGSPLEKAACIRYQQVLTLRLRRCLPVPGQSGPVDHSGSCSLLLLLGHPRNLRPGKARPQRLVPREPQAERLLRP